MIPYQTYPVARYRMEQARLSADHRRLRRTAGDGALGAYGAGVIDALGHGLIAIGSRLVTDRRAHSPAHPGHRRAA